MKKTGRKSKFTTTETKPLTRRGRRVAKNKFIDPREVRKSKKRREEAKGKPQKEKYYEEVVHYANKTGGDDPNFYHAIASDGPRTKGKAKKKIQKAAFKKKLKTISNSYKKAISKRK